MSSLTFTSKSAAMRPNNAWCRWIARKRDTATICYVGGYEVGTADSKGWLMLASGLESLPLPPHHIEEKRIGVSRIIELQDVADVGDLR